MSSPWKKVKKINRIPKKIVNDLQGSQKKRDGSSLVVETGFPTSLVDLFIKNREELKTSSKKKQQFTPTPPMNTPLSCPSPLQSPLLDDGQKTIVPENEESACEVLGPVKCKKSRRANMKAKMKKLMAIKSKFSRQIHLSEKYGSVLRNEDESYQREYDSEESVGANVISVSASRPLSVVKERTTSNANEVSCKMQNVSSLRHPMILCLIILIGLVQSRSTALMLALVYFLLLEIMRCYIQRWVFG